MQIMFNRWGKLPACHVLGKVSVYVTVKSPFVDGCTS